ncbi:hypothetical protein [Ensifer sp. YR511]|uniref:hypothetical protein n=1 Tax=Ensifer sp. YR511 TaxID=1855294 RepID=UPI001FCD8E4B|nr:hypothetical protein [Ensifer sp. YR511]
MLLNNPVENRPVVQAVTKFAMLKLSGSASGLATISACDLNAFMITRQKGASATTTEIERNRLPQMLFADGAVDVEWLIAASLCSSRRK